MPYLIFLLIFLAGCENTENAKTSFSVPAKKDLHSTSYLIMSKAGKTDFTLPFYLDAKEMNSRKYFGSIPDGRTGYISQATFTSMVIMDEIVAYYKKGRNVYVRDFDTAIGRKIILSDNPDLTIFPDAKTSGATTIVMSRSEHGFTDLVYTSFKVSAQKP